MELTIAIASACIAASIAVYQFVLPNALALILTGLLSEEQPAVTWSVVSRFFLSSDWPLFLRSEAATATGVPAKIALVTWTKPLGLLLIAIAAVVTPLGLYDEIGPASSAEIAQFSYVPDDSPLAAGTLARSGRGYNFSRMCSGYLCPGDTDKGNVSIPYVYNTTNNETRLDNQRVVSNSIAPSLIDFYQSGSEQNPPSLAGYFDIEAREWSTEQYDYVENNETLLTPTFKYLATVYMDNKIELFEGLIVDTKDGGVGFRNHSVPSANSVYGAEWEEDILWMQPETSCVDSNITLFVSGMPDNMYEGTTGIVDRGGFSDLQKVDPYYHPPNTTYNYIFEDAQKNPFLYERAFYAAWFTNAIVMNYLNVSDPGTNRSRISSTIGQQFKVNTTLASTTIEGSYSTFLKLDRGKEMLYMPSMYGWNETLQGYNFDQNSMIPNPHNVTDDDLSLMMNYCKGGLGGDQANISMLDIGLGFIAGPGLLTNKTDPNNASSFETWERPYHSCASATKISLKTVRFRYNSTKEATLKNLEVLDIRDKKYESDSDKPLWGFETPTWEGDTKTSWNLSTLAPLWGILDPSIKTNQNVTTLRSDRFYLPASYASGGVGTWLSPYSYQGYTPGTTGPASAWKIVFSPDITADPYVGNEPSQERFFRDMTRDPTLTARLMNLLWTDLVANSMIGTRGLHSAKYVPLAEQKLMKSRRALFGRGLGEPEEIDFGNLEQGQYPVYPLERHIRYKWYYGIVGFLCFALLGIVVLLAAISMLCGRGTVNKLRWYMFNTNSGRLLAAWVYPETMPHRTIETPHWLNHVGKRTVVLASGNDIGGFGSGMGVARELHPMPSSAPSPSPGQMMHGKGGVPGYVKVEQKEETESVSSQVPVLRLTPGQQQ